MEDPTKKYIQLQIETLKKTLTELQATFDEIDSSQDTTAKSTESSNDPDIESANVAKVDVNSSNSTATLQTEDQTLSNASGDTEDDTTAKSTESSNDPDIGSVNVAKVDVNSSNSTATLQTEDQTLSNASEDTQDDTTAKSTESSNNPDIESANVAKVDVNSSNSTATLQDEDQTQKEATLSNDSEDTQDDTKVKSTESSNDPDIESANVAMVDVNSSNSTATLQDEDQTLSNASEDTQDDTTAKSTESSNDPDIESANVAKVDVNSSNSTATLQDEDQTLSNAPEDTQDDTKVKSTESSNDPDIESANVAKVDVNSSNSTATLQDEDQTLSNAPEDTQDDTKVKFTESSRLDDPVIGSANVAKLCATLSHQNPQAAEDTHDTTDKSTEYQKMTPSEKAAKIDRNACLLLYIKNHLKDNPDIYETFLDSIEPWALIRSKEPGVDKGKAMNGKFDEIRRIFIGNDHLYQAFIQCIHFNDISSISTKVRPAISNDVQADGRPATTTQAEKTSEETSSLADQSDELEDFFGGDFEKYLDEELPVVLQDDLKSVANISPLSSECGEEAVIIERDAFRHQAVSENVIGHPYYNMTGCNLGILDTNLEAIVRYYSSFWDLMINNQTPGKTVLLQYEKWHGVEPNSSMRKKKLGRLFKPNGKIPGKQLLETKRDVEVKLGVTFHSLLHFLLSIDAIDNFGYGSKVLISKQTELEWEEMNEVQQTAVNWAGSLLVDMRSLAQRRQRKVSEASKELKRKFSDLEFE